MFIGHFAMGLGVKKTAGNLFGPPPESTAAIAVAGLAQWLLVAWGYWVDRNREQI